MKSFFTAIGLNVFSALWCKAFIVSLIAITVCTNAGLSQTLWMEDWEGNWTTDWHVDAGTWEVGTPTSGPDNAYNGQNCAATVLAGNYPPNTNTRLIRHTSFVVPSAAQNPRLRFWHWYSIAGGDFAEIQISTDGLNWQTISPTYTNTGSGIWTYPYIDLSAYANSTVQIAFYFHSDVGSGSSLSFGWYIDDITIITGPVVFNNPETWEMGLGDWYGDRGTWEVGEPTSGSGSAHNGQNCAATVLNGNYYPNIDSRFISPLFTLPGADQNPRLRFWHWYSIAGGDFAEIQICTDGLNWQTISPTYTNTGSGIWTYPYIDLSAYANSTVQIAFYFHSDVGSGSSLSSGWYIDDITIITGPVVFNNPETWEMGLGDWYGDRGTWEVGEPTSGPGSAHIGQNCAATVLNGNYYPNIDSRFISPLFTLPGADQNPSLNFWHWYSIAGGDAGNVLIKTESGEWQSILGPYINTSGGVWSPVYADLSAYGDSTVQIAFYFHSDVGSGSSLSSGWYIDDIMLLPGIVPVELASFTSSLINGNVKLEWTTATETNNQGFEIQRSKEDKGFFTIGFVNGKGTTTEKQNYSFIDKNINNGKYYYRLKQIDFDGSFEYSNEVAVNVTLPLKFALEQNYPNPFNPTTRINYSIHKTSFVTIRIYDALGSEVTSLVNEEKPAGSYEVNFDATNLSSGIYFYKIQAGDFVKTKKMLLLN